jgi:aryl-alcohol dehydrogenase-like predicted oxidoreductase
MEQRPFGSTGVQVPVLGFGAGHIGSPASNDVEAGRVLDAALDAGINLIDTARGYELSEERIGRRLSHRRDEFVLSTKVGYNVPEVPDWSAAAVTGGIDRALGQLVTDTIDVCFLHSCDLDVLEAGEAVDALRRAQEEGKVRVCGYSGEGPELEWAIESGAFGAIQTSVNLADQWTAGALLPRAVEAGLGVIAKRPLANAAWRFRDRPVGRYEEPYW